MSRGGKEMEIIPITTHPCIEKPGLGVVRS